MANYKEKYRKFFGYHAGDFVPCAVCASEAVDIHHIKFRSQGGGDDIENLIGLCRRCHDTAHGKNPRTQYPKGLLYGLQRQLIKTRLAENPISVIKI